MPGGATVTVADILELRADGLSEGEVWSLLCQAVQTLQDLFLSGEIIGEPVVPLVRPHTLGITSKGSVVISLACQARPRDEDFLAPEYRARGDGTSSDLDWEKMWVYSLGRSLLSSLRADSATGDSLAVLRLMTAEEPRVRASLVSLLNIISTRRRTSAPPKPFSHLVMEMYREVFGTPPQCLLPPETPVRMVGQPGGVVAEDPAPRATADGTAERTESSSPEPAKKGEHSPPSSSGESFGESAKTPAPPRRNPVQRAPSRLYRGPAGTALGADGQSRGVRPGECVGPEFVVRATEQKVVHVGEAKESQRRTLTVILLAGQRVRVACDPRALTCGKLFEVLVQVEQLEDNYLFGVACSINGDLVFVPPETKLHKVAPAGWKTNGNRSAFFLYLRVKFFLPSLRGVKNRKTRHLMYLQLRRSLLEQQIKCELPELFALGGLALQAEFGDFRQEEHGTASYFLLEHYLPDELIDDRPELEERLQHQHRSRSGLDPGRAEEMFVARAQRLPEYGSHHHTAYWVRKTVNIPMWVTVSPQGVYLYEKKKNVLDRKVHEAFVWKNIQGFNCTESLFRLVPHCFGQKATCYKLRLENKKSVFLFRLAAFHHQFFLKLRIELSPLHVLSREFGVSLEKEGKRAFRLERSPGDADDRGPGRGERKPPPSCRRSPAGRQQNKENENPATEGVTERREKRPGVKMGVRAFRLPQKDAPEGPEAADASLDAYVIDSSIKSSAEKFSYDLHESVPSPLAARFAEVPWEEERILRKVHLAKDKYGSFGLEVAEGPCGGLFVENTLKPRGEDDIAAVRRGDRLLAVNGVCLLSLNYADALAVLKAAGDRIQVLVSQAPRDPRGQTAQNPPEREYLRSIRYETANEADASDPEAPRGNFPRSDSTRDG